jgi:hypothetical protein
MHPDTGVLQGIERIKSVFLEVPGTQLCPGDVSRLSGLEKTTCVAIFEALEDTRFLAGTRNGLFVRRSADSPMA